MSLHVTANRRATVAPRYMTRPYRMTPMRRDFIHGRVQPMDRPAAPISGTWIMFCLAVASPFIAALAGVIA